MPGVSLSLRKAGSAPATHLALLPAVAIAGQIVVAAVTATLARRLSVDAFEVYAIAAALFVALVAAAPLGADKLAAQLLPAALAAADRARIAAILGFALRRALAGTLALAVAGLVLGLAATTPGLAAALAVAMAALPPAVFAHLALEVLAAAGRPLWPMAVLKLGVPANVLALIGTGLAGSAPRALVAWGVGWCLAAAVLGATLRRVVPGIPLRLAAGPVPEAWMAASRDLWVHRLVTVVMAQAGILALALSDAPAAQVGAYAAATTLAGLLRVLATSTSRPYTRAMALLLARGDPHGLRALARRRLRWLGPALALALLPLLIAPGRVLALFRPEFADAGTGALRILSAAAAVDALLALSSAFLKLDGQARLLSRIAFATLATQLLLLALLAPRLGATGVAAACAIATAGQSIALTICARRAMLRTRETAQSSIVTDTAT
ncbi:MAG: hypothetical protein U1E40_16050 [Amaricoccus sp.]